MLHIICSQCVSEFHARVSISYEHFLSFLGGSAGLALHVHNQKFMPKCFNKKLVIVPFSKFTIMQLLPLTCVHSVTN